MNTVFGLKDSLIRIQRSLKELNQHIEMHQSGLDAFMTGLEDLRAESSLAKSKLQSLDSKGKKTWKNQSTKRQQ